MILAQNKNLTISFFLKDILGKNILFCHNIFAKDIVHIDMHKILCVGHNIFCKDIVPNTFGKK